MPLASCRSRAFVSRYGVSAAEEGAREAHAARLDTRRCWREGAGYTAAVDHAMDRTYPVRPWVAVGVVVVRDGKVLLVQRGRDPGRGVWAVPGGMVDLGETCREAARREAKEETGLDVEVGDVFWVGEYIGRDAGGRVTFHNVLIDYLARAPEGEAVCADDAMEVRWCGPEDLVGQHSRSWPLPNLEQWPRAREVAH